MLVCLSFLRSYRFQNGGRVSSLLWGNMSQGAERKISMPPPTKPYSKSAAALRYQWVYTSVWLKNMAEEPAHTSSSHFLPRPVFSAAPMWFLPGLWLTITRALRKSEKETALETERKTAESWQWASLRRAEGRGSLKFNDLETARQCLQATLITPQSDSRCICFRGKKNLITPQSNCGCICFRGKENWGLERVSPLPTWRMTHLRFSVSFHFSPVRFPPNVSQPLNCQANSASKSGPNYINT